MIIEKYYEDLKKVHINTMPPRAYYVPEGTGGRSRRQLLNGIWDFQYHASVYDLEERFWEEDHSMDGADKVSVPGTWQDQGYDRYQYTNLRYPFPIDPPFVPQDDPCGAYVRRFIYHKEADAPRAYLVFDGVDSCFYVWLNGTFVGYSQVSHSPSEFDVTDHIREGENKLAVLVLKWCDGSYLEDQDKFRTSGIFRDVYLLKRAEQGIFDHFITTSVKEDHAMVDIRIRFLDQIVPVRAALDGGVQVGTALLREGGYQQCISLRVDHPKLWDPEQPYLYDLSLVTENEVIHEKIGIRTIDIQGNVVRLNGNAIKFRGVNRHEFDPVTGPVISMEQMEQDLLLMKQHNINAIRTSHYPSAPCFYHLCDEYGFMVIDEADNESHGAQCQFLRDPSWENTAQRWNERIADAPDFIDVTVDRVQRCVHRDKNRPCVIVWSMGNECAYGCTFEAALEWTKGFDPSRLTHFESAFYRNRKKKYDLSAIDLYSRMYPSLDEIREYLDGSPDKPFLMCEYCHAMGNGPGDLEDYFQMIDRHDEMCGGFVWEWCDHAVYKGLAENGKAMYFYGGDHGERLHDGNFCVDGLVFPDRTPHTGLLEFKNVHRPARAAAYDQCSGALSLKNHMDHVDLKDYLSVAYEVTCDGKTVSAGKIASLPSIKPHDTGQIVLMVTVPDKGKCYLRLSYHLRQGTAFLPEGYVLGSEEIPLANADERNQTAAVLLARRPEQACLDRNTFEIHETDRSLSIQGGSFSCAFDKRTGLPASWSLGQEILDRPMEINIWRAPTDNDRKMRLEWERAFYDHTVTRAYALSHCLAADGIHIKSVQSVAADSIQRILDINADWTVGYDGALSVAMEVRRDMEFPPLPRFGLRLFLPVRFDRVTYCGLGPQESYVDKHRAAGYGCYKSMVEGFHEAYIKPQENGSRWGCDYVMAEDASMSLWAVSTRPFSFNASIYTQEELTAKQHDHELAGCGSTVLCLDYRHNGIGSNSCGPALLSAYELSEDRFCFDMRLIPIEKAAPNGRSRNGEG